MYLKIVTCFSPSWPPLAGPVDPRVENPVTDTVDWCMFLIGDCFAYSPLILFVSLYLWHRWVQLRDDFVYDLRDLISFKLLTRYILNFDFSICEIQRDAPVIVQPLIPSSPVHVPAYPSQQTYVQPSAPGNLFNPWIEILFSTQLPFKFKKRQEFQALILTVLVPLTHNCTKC